MSFKSKLSIVNQCFVFVGGGSVKYGRSKWISIKYLCRLLPIYIYVHGKNLMEFYELVGIVMVGVTRYYNNYRVYFEGFRSLLFYLIILFIIGM